jgi:protein-S-isoprenylcysteine O-methyltransferase Ste14
MGSASTSGNNKAIGWGFVGAQIVLLAAFVLVPSASDWTTPRPLNSIAALTALLGLIIVAVAAAGLGQALTATPVPKDGGQLRTTGLYRFVRHPIYSGMLLFVASSVVSSTSFVKAAIGGALVVFFTVKSNWEEAQLRRQYPDYDEYAARTPRMIPNPWRSSKG